MDIPIVLYNVPGRTAVNMMPAAVEELSRHPRIVGIKEATANLDQISEVIERCGPEFAVISGDDMTFLPTLAVGGVGVISVTANVAPDRIAALYDAWTRGDRDEALRVHQSLQPLNRAMFLETNPIPVKTALSLMGRCSDEMRLPSLPWEKGTRKSSGPPCGPPGWSAREGLRKMNRIVVTGAAGRMGSQIVSAVLDARDLKMGGATERKGHPSFGKDIGELIGRGKVGVLLTDRLEAVLPGPRR